jgi:putative OPT family oligopeptide transporter
LISALAKGVIQGSLDWGLLGIGMLVGIAIIAADELLGLARRMRMPPLAVGIGIYLPAATTAAVIVGAVAGHLYNGWAKQQRNGAMALQLGVLLASGLIVGESLAGVAYSGIIVASREATPLQPSFITDAFATPATIIGALAFALVVAGLYGWLRKLARPAA